jgi:hypothetical protein
MNLLTPGAVLENPKPAPTQVGPGPASRNINSREVSGMNIYPTDERRIREVERSRSCQAVVPLPPGGALAAGDVLLFALARSSAGQEPDYLMGGDSVRVLLTGVTDLDEADPVTGQALFQLTWEPLGQDGPPANRAVRAVKSDYALRRA